MTNKELIEKLQEKQVLFSEGLSLEEFQTIESIFNVKFPKELRNLFGQALPISDGFYNWRNLSTENIYKIKQAIARPAEGILEGVDEIDWNDNWGKEPDSITEKEHIILEELRSSAPLVPIYKHRYITTQFDDINPVLSICDTDVIYAGENLEKYLLIEFKYKKFSDISYREIKKVNFWSDIM